MEDLLQIEQDLDVGHDVGGMVAYAYAHPTGVRRLAIAEALIAGLSRRMAKTPGRRKQFSCCLMRLTLGFISAIAIESGIVQSDKTHSGTDLKLFHFPYAKPKIIDCF